MPFLAAAVLAFTPGIRTPTGNITCFVTHATLRCEIAQASYRPRLQRRCAATAGVDWHGFELPASGRPRVTCSGGILYDPAQGKPRYRTLAYGSVRRIAPFTCTSRITGLTCTNRTGHGIFLSRQSWRGW